MSKVSEAFADLDEATQARILRWAADKYGLVQALEGSRPPSAAPLQEDRSAEVSDTTGGDQAEVQQVSATSTSGSEYLHFADLYNACQPITSAQKALTAAYWVQVIQGADSFQSLTLNKLLKDLGYGLDRINDALASNIAAKPALVLQVKRGGSSQQSRKTYKMTGAGISSIKASISGNS